MVYLPTGEWVDYWSREVHEGPLWLNYPAPLDVLPLFVRRDSIIPMGPEVDCTDRAAGASLTLDIYPASGGRCTIYDEDAPPVEISYTVDETGLQLTIIGALPAPPVVILNGFPTARRVTVNHRSHDRWRSEEDRLIIELTEAGAAEVIVWR